MEYEVLAPRLKHVSAEISKLSALEAGHRESMAAQQLPIVGPEEIEGHLNDLHDVLDTAPAAQKKALLQSFVGRIEVDGPEVTIEYTFPPEGESACTVGGKVLCMEGSGVADGT